MNKKLFIAFTFLTIFVSEGCKEKNEGTSLELNEEFLSQQDSLIHTQNLGRNNVLKLSSNMIRLDSGMFDFNLVADFLMIDSLKRAGKYQQYIASLDIGMVADASAFMIDSLRFESTNALLWAVKSNSYEACPYSEGIDIFLTVFKGKQAMKTTKVASRFNFSDPPVAFESLLTASINGNEILLNYHDKNLDLPDDGDQFQVVEEKYLKFRLDLEKGTYTSVK